MAIELIVTLAVPVLVKVTTWASLVLPKMVAGNAMEAGLNVTVEVPDAMAVPVKATVCGEPVALSATESNAVSVPAAVGLNSTETVQVALAASEVPQVVADLRNEVAFVPVMVSDDSVTAVVLVFFTVTICAVEVEPMAVDAKVKLAGESVTVRAPAAVAVPVSATVCGEPVALSATDRLPDFAPAVTGLNSTEIVQVALAANVVPQVFADTANEVKLAPVRVSEVKVTADVPVFFTVIVCAAEVEFAAVEPNVRLVGESVTESAAAVAVPFSATVCGEPVALSATEREPVKEPAAVGLNSTEIVQLAPAANEVEHVVADFTNELAFVPVKVSEVRVTADVPVFLTVTTCADVVDPTVVEAKVRLVGDSVTAGAVVVVGQAFTRLATLNVPRPVVRS
jgi:hypothetical protein